jgi:hypothetical protein
MNFSTPQSDEFKCSDCACRSIADLFFIFDANVSKENDVCTSTTN